MILLTAGKRRGTMNIVCVSDYVYILFIGV